MHDGEGLRPRGDLLRSRSSGSTVRSRGTEHVREDDIGAGITGCIGRRHERQRGAKNFVAGSDPSTRFARWSAAVQFATANAYLAPTRAANARSEFLGHRPHRPATRSGEPRVTAATSSSPISGLQGIVQRSPPGIAMSELLWERRCRYLDSPGRSRRAAEVEPVAVPRKRVDRVVLPKHVEHQVVETVAPIARNALERPPVEDIDPHAGVELVQGLLAESDETTRRLASPRESRTPSAAGGEGGQRQRASRSDVASEERGVVEVGQDVAGS